MPWNFNSNICLEMALVTYGKMGHFMYICMVMSQVIQILRYAMEQV